MIRRLIKTIALVLIVFAGSGTGMGQDEEVVAMAPARATPRTIRVEVSPPVREETLPGPPDGVVRPSYISWAPTSDLNRSIAALEFDLSVVSAPLAPLTLAGSDVSHCLSSEIALTAPSYSWLERVRPQVELCLPPRSVVTTVFGEKEYRHSMVPPPPPSTVPEPLDDPFIDVLCWMPITIIALWGAKLLAARQVPWGSVPRRTPPPPMIPRPRIIVPVTRPARPWTIQDRFEARQWTSGWIALFILGGGSIGLSLAYCIATLLF